MLADAEPSVLITDKMRLREAGPLVEALPSLRCLLWDDRKGGINRAPTDAPYVYQSISWDDLHRYPGEQPTCASIDVDLATLIYTSGSTGQPKGVMCSHRSMVAVTNSINAYLKNTYDDIILNVLPLAFGYGLYQLFLAAQVGATVVLDKGFAFPAKTVALLEQERVTALPGCPMLYALLLKYPDLLKRDLSAPSLHDQRGRGPPYRPPAADTRRAAPCAVLLDVRADRMHPHLLLASRRRWIAILLPSASQSPTPKST